MKVTGKQTTTKTVEVEINENEVKGIVHGQSVDYLAAALQEKLLYEFLHSLEPGFVGKRMIREGWLSRHKGKLALIHVDADWNYHNNVGEDREVRLLTDDEEEKYKILCNIARTIVELQK